MIVDSIKLIIKVDEGAHYLVYLIKKFGEYLLLLQNWASGRENGFLPWL